MIVTMVAFHKIMTMSFLIAMVSNMTVDILVIAILSVFHSTRHKIA